MVPQTFVPLPPQPIPIPMPTFFPPQPPMYAVPPPPPTRAPPPPPSVDDEVNLKQIVEQLAMQNNLTFMPTRRRHDNGSQISPPPSFPLLPLLFFLIPLPYLFTAFLLLFWLILKPTSHTPAKSSPSSHYFLNSY